MPSIFALFISLQIQFLGQANFQSPPSSLQFDHVPKRLRREKPMSSQPEIHVHIPGNLIPSSSSRLDPHFLLGDRRRPISAKFTQSSDLIDLTTSDDEPTSYIVKCEGKRRKIKVEGKENNGTF